MTTFDCRKYKPDVWINAVISFGFACEYVKL